MYGSEEIFFVHLLASAIFNSELTLKVTLSFIYVISLTLPILSTTYLVEKNEIRMQEIQLGNIIHCI